MPLCYLNLFGPLLLYDVLEISIPLFQQLNLTALNGSLMIEDAHNLLQFTFEVLKEVKLVLMSGRIRRNWDTKGRLVRTSSCASCCRRQDIVLFHSV